MQTEAQTYMKIERHSKIIELINEYDIETQEELAELLNQAGYNVTQATVSRDIRQLKLIKQTVNGKQKYVVLQTGISDMNEKYIRILKDGFVSMAMAQNILVIKPFPEWQWQWRRLTQWSGISGWMYCRR